MHVIFQARKLRESGAKVPAWQHAFPAQAKRVTLSIQEAMDPELRRTVKTARLIDADSRAPVPDWPELYSADLIYCDEELRITGYERVFDKVGTRDYAQTWQLVPVGVTNYEEDHLVVVEAPDGSLQIQRSSSSAPRK